MLKTDDFEHAPHGQMREVALIGKYGGAILAIVGAFFSSGPAEAVGIAVMTASQIYDFSHPNIKHQETQSPDQP